MFSLFFASSFHVLSTNSTCFVFFSVSTRKGPKLTPFHTLSFLRITVITTRVVAVVPPDGLRLYPRTCDNAAQRRKNHDSTEVTSSWRPNLSPKLRLNLHIFAIAFDCTTSRGSTVTISRPPTRGVAALYRFHDPLGVKLTFTSLHP